jgi:HTH-type transcriptional regulator, glycine betaine synthesis regulator
MTTAEPTRTSPLVEKFIEEAGRTTQLMGVGRVLGQIYAYLYFSAKPRNLADLQRDLGISKGSASIGVRQLEQWEAVRKVWVKGDRRDYHVANDWFGRIFKRALADTIGNRLSAYAALIQEAEEQVLQMPNANRDFVRDRIRHMRSFQKRAQKMWSNPVIRNLLK